MTAEPQTDLLDGHRHPTGLEFLVAAFIAASALLHIIAMFPLYFGGPGEASIWSQPDQAALYSVLAAGWVVTLVIGLTGPKRLPAAAGMAVGLAVTEFGFRLSDLGQVFRYGTSTAGAGLWLMTVAWVVGALGAGLAVLAVHRARRTNAAGATPGPDRDSSQVAGVPIDEAHESDAGPPEGRWAPDTLTAPTAVGPADDTTGLADRAGAEDTTGLVDLAGADETAPLDPTSSFQPAGAATDPVTDHLWAEHLERTGHLEWTGHLESAEPADDERGRPSGATIALVVILAAITAGAFLPAWDHYTGVVTSTGRSVSFNLGNAFSGPWQVVLGTVLGALAILAVPIVAVTRRNRVVGAALISGCLVVLAAQFAAAVVQVDAAVPSAIVGLTPGRASQLGLQLHLGLTSWFTVDLLIAFALFITAMVVAFSRPVEPEVPPE
jgi:hypothetical protein